MAEAAVESPVGRFFCHKCTQEISPLLPDFICPRCQSGFIEELEQEVSNDLHEEDFPSGYFGFYDDAGTADDSVTDDTTPSSSTPRRGRSLSWQSSSPTRDNNSRRRFIVERNVAPLEGLLNQILANLTRGGGFGGNASIPIFFNLHSNPGDYAWGRGGLDAIITQLLNQLDSTGPPPLPKDKIGLIPTVQITQDQVDKLLQCTVCMEDFKTGEPVRRLLCLHHFHNGCIVPWLELHGTCPICRKSLNEDVENSSSSSSNNTNSSNGGGSSGSSSSSSTAHSVYDFNEYD